MPIFKTFQRASIALAVSQAISISSLAATINVTNASDLSADNECTLRDAIIAAETDEEVAGCLAGSNNDIIDLTGLNDNSTITLASELPTISSSITINGRGQDLLSISGNNQSRIINVTTGGELTLSSLTLTQGSTFFNGGAIKATSATVSMDFITITANGTSFSGGGIDSTNSTITISNSILSNNRTGQYGGGINSSDSEIVISNSTLSGNSVSGPSVLSGSTYSGGGIRSKNDTLTIRDSTLSGNSSRQNGGAIDSYFSALTIDNSRLSDNSTRDGGGIKSDGGSIDINQSILSNNNADVNGGAIFAFRTFMSINNSTLSGNSASMNGGGMSSEFSTITIDHTTMSENTADNIGSGLQTRDLSVTINNSIIVGNSLGSRDGAEVFNQSGSIEAKNNIFGFNELTNSSAFFGFTPDSTNIIATSDGLNLAVSQIINPLSNNGGDSFTHGLPDNSPAFNASNNINCPEDDQRGEPRNDGQCDIGAFEGDSGLVLEDQSFFVIPIKNGNAIIFEL